MSRLLVLLPALALASTAFADEGWECGATSQWTVCADGNHCTTEQTQSQATDSSREHATDLALTACRQDTQFARLRAAWLAAPQADPATISRIDSACATTTCSRVEWQPSALADAFDEPVCIGVRRYICDLCGQDSPLCSQVQEEQPVTADACSQTHVRLQMFSDLMGQVDTLQPGAWSGSRDDLCGTGTNP